MLNTDTYDGLNKSLSAPYERVKYTTHNEEPMSQSNTPSQLNGMDVIQYTHSMPFEKEYREEKEMDDNAPIILVQLKRVYGVERFYPMSNDAKTICKLLNATTLTKDQLKVCKDAGWDVKVKTEEYKLD